MSVITISRQLGSFGKEIAVKAAELLDYAVVDKQLITEVARAAKVPEEEVEQYDEQEEEGIKAFLMSLFFGEGHPQPPEAFPAYAWALDFPYQVPVLVPPPEESEATEEVHFLDRAEYLRLMETTVRHLYQRGNVVIVGRGAMMVLKDAPNLLCVRVFASEEFRAESLARVENLDYKSALQKVRQSDRRRAAYVRRHYHVDWNDPSLYHLIINTEKTGLDLAAEMVAGGARALAAKVGRQGG